MKTRIDRLREIFDRESLSDYLPYEAYDRATGIFLLDQGVGVLHECLPRVSVGLDVLQPMEALYSASFLPSGSCIQMMLYPSRDIDSYLSLWSRARSSSPLSQKMVKNRLALLKGARLSDIMPAPLRDFRLLISTMPNIKAGPEETVRIAAETAAKVEGLLESARLFPKKVSAEGLIHLLREILNPGHSQTLSARWDRINPIRKQLLFADTPLVIEPTRFVLDGHYYKSFTIMQYPEEAPADLLNRIIGDDLKAIDQIPLPFILTLNAVLLDPDKDVKSIETKAAAATYQSIGFLANILPEIAEKKKNFDILLKDLKNGQRPVRVYLHLILYAPDPAILERYAQQVIGFWRKSGIILQENEIINLPLFLSSLPLGLDAELEAKLLRCGRTMSSSNAAYLSPVYADWKGTGSPGLFLVSRRGQVMLFDPFDSPGNKNVVTAATSRAGKSFLVNELCGLTLDLGGRDWIIDLGRSYFKLCELRRGDFIEFRPEAPPCLNFFSRIDTLEGEDSEMDKILPLICQMASPNEPLSSLYMSFLEQAIQKVFAKYGKESNITVVADDLAGSSDQRARDLATMLYPYTRKGRYGHFFHGQMNSLSDNSFVVLELEELRSKGELKSVILLLLIYYIQSETYEGDRSLRKLIVIDEAWDLLGGGHSARFIEAIARTIGKYGGGLSVITQGINDLTRTDAGSAVLANSDNLILLRQKPESILALKESAGLAMDNTLMEYLSSINTVPNRYSEAYIRTPLGSGIGRLIVDRYSALVYTSRAEEFARIKSFQDQGLSIEEAIEKCLV